MLLIVLGIIVVLIIVAISLLFFANQSHGTHRKVGGSGSSEDLAKEYYVWKLSDELLKIACQSGMGPRCRVKLEGWVMKSMLTTTDESIRKSRFGVLGVPLNRLSAFERDLSGDSTLDKSVIDKVVRELRELSKKYPPIKRVNAAVETIRPDDVGTINELISTTGMPDDVQSNIGSMGAYKYLGYIVVITDKIARMVSIAGVDKTVQATMRYSSIFAGAHQWAVPSVVMDTLYEFGVRNEAFASCINSGMMGRDGSRFFSLFRDVEAPFGSKGNWTSYHVNDLAKFDGGWEINPPFVFILLKAASERGAELSKTRDVFFITRIHDPSYTPDHPYEAINSVCKASRTLTMENHVYEINTPNGTQLKAPTFSTHLLYAGPKSVDEANALLDILIKKWPSVPTVDVMDKVLNCGDVRDVVNGGDVVNVRRIDEVVKASKSAPVHLLKTRLPWYGSSYFSYVNGHIIPTPYPAYGVYYGINYSEDAGRTTLLNPAGLGWISTMTSGNTIAWVLLNSSECDCLIRVDPLDKKINGTIGKSVSYLDPEIISSWLLKNMNGEPPHKVSLNKYVHFLQDRMGMNILIGNVYHKDVRFCRIDTLTRSEYERERALLRNLSQMDFDHMDWKSYDKKIDSLVRDMDEEMSGDIEIIGLGSSKMEVIISKVRKGLTFWSMGISRSHIHFHTHPNDRFNGTFAESPSFQDIKTTIASQGINVWSFIAAPEGTYIIRPTDMLRDAYYKNPDQVIDSADQQYKWDQCTDSVMLCVESTIRTLTEMGMVAYFHKSPKYLVHPNPNVYPSLNGLDTELYSRGFREASDMNAHGMAHSNWKNIITSMRVHPGFSSSEIIYLGAIVLDGTARIFGSTGHRGSTNSMNEEFANVLIAPILVIYFPRGNMPKAVSIDYAERSVRAREFAWIVFLSNDNVLPFRVVNGVIESELSDT